MLTMYFRNGPALPFIPLVNRKGVSILISDRLKTTIHSRHTSDTGHLIVLDLSIDDNRLILGTVYAPTGCLDGIANPKEFSN